MFSKRALANLDSRGRSPYGYLIYANESFRESIDFIRQHGGLAGSLCAFTAAFQAVVLLALLPLYIFSRPEAFLALFLFTLAGTVLLVLWLLLHISLIKDKQGAVTKLNLANKLTIIRFLLIPQLLFLIADNRFIAALLVYIVCSGTDILDGYAARKRDEQTPFGVVMDPLADVFSTAGVFTVLMLKNLVPTWIFALLMVRYGMLFAGTIVLFFTLGPIEFRATPVGKIVGVLQAVAVIMIVGFAFTGVDIEAVAGRYLFPLLGLLFGSVIVSQLVFGIRFVRKRTVKVGS